MRGRGLLAGVARSHFVRASAGSLGVRVASLLLVVVVQLLLSRMLGAKGYGEYAYILAWINALIVPATLGSERLIVREVAVFRAHADWESWHGLMRWAGRSTLAASFTLAVLAAAGAWLVAGERAVSGGFWLATLLLPLLAAMRLRQYVLQGMHMPELGQLPEGLVQPLALIAMLGAAHAGLGETTVPGVVAMNVSATCAALVCAAALVARHLPGEVRAAQPKESPAWARSIVPLLLVSGTQALNAQTPVLMMGALGGAEMAGVLSIARRLADLAVLPAMAAGIALTPVVARAWTLRDMAGMQRAVTTFARGGTALGLALALVLVGFREPLLGAFGAEFQRGGGAVILLLAGNLFNIATGAMGLVLVMTGHEREAARIAVTCALLNLALCAALIPRWGIEGAAGAASLSVIVWNCWLAERVRRRVGIRASIFALPPDARGAR